MNLANIYVKALKACFTLIIFVNPQVKEVKSSVKLA